MILLVDRVAPEKTDTLAVLPRYQYKSNYKEVVMPKVLKDITGQRFGHFVVIRQVPRDTGRARWICRCDCGKEFERRHCNIVHSGVNTSCGCYESELLKIKHANNVKFLHPNKSKLITTWNAMIARCHRPNHKSFKYYGDKGIFVCDEWRNNPTSFYNWAIENGHSNELSLDRLDNSKGYSPDNCRWVNLIEQASNKTNNHILEYQGVSGTASAWARLLNIKTTTFHRWLKNMPFSEIAEKSLNN